MSAKIFRFVRNDRVNDYIALGWFYHRSLEGCHHGVHAGLLEWQHDCPPQEPVPEILDCAG